MSRRKLSGDTATGSLFEKAAMRLEHELMAGIRDVFVGLPADARPGSARGALPAGKLLGAIEEEARVCAKCRLGKLRTRAVPGEGDPRARLVFVGEAPGADEDAQGRPFVGKAGQLLVKIIEAIGFSRESVFICNVLKCRPPENRAPLPDEIAFCIPYLHRQLAAVKPDAIVALGGFAAKILLSTDAPVSRLRGRFAEYRGIKVMPTFHPAYLLRNPAEKRKVWEDMKKVRDLLGSK